MKGCGCLDLPEKVRVIYWLVRKLLLHLTVWADIFCFFIISTRVEGEQLWKVSAMFFVISIRTFSLLVLPLSMLE